jgi:Fe2+ or Zn2+ uptake regulation protein
MRKLILKWLGLEDIPNRVNQLEENQDELVELKGKLTDNLMEGRPQLRHTLQLLDGDHLTRKEIVNELTETFDISRPTAYRRVKELEDELQFIEKTDKGYKCLVDVS